MSLHSSLPVSSSQPVLESIPTQNASLRAERVPGKKIVRDLGLKVTAQRLAILETVRKGPNHFTAQEIFEAVSIKSPDIGFATVYRFLRTLSERRYVTEVRMGGMPARYEWATKRHHDHLTCVSCSNIVEFENDEIEMLQERVARQNGFKLSSHVLELYGVCPSCQAKPAPAQSPAPANGRAAKSDSPALA